MIDLDPAARAAAPMTTGFQFQIGPDGACRIVLLGTATDPDTVVAVLELDAPTADALAQQIQGRRAAYQQRRHAH